LNDNRIISEELIGKDMEGSVRGMIQSSIPKSN